MCSLLFLSALISLFSKSEAVFFNLPNAIDLETNYYRGSLCNNSNDIFRTTSFKTLCLESHDECCETNLKKLSFNKNATLNTCYTDILNNNTISFNYSCGSSNFNEINSTVVDFAIVGVIFTIFTCISIIYLTVHFCCFRRRRDSYGKI